MNWLAERVHDWNARKKQNKPVLSLSEHLGMSLELYTRWANKPHEYVMGIDEVGYGAIAGPLVVGAVIAPFDWFPKGVKDSKKFGAREKAEIGRADVLSTLHNDADYLLIESSIEEINEKGIYHCLLQSFATLAKWGLAKNDDLLVVLDGDSRIAGLEHVALPKADSFVPQVSAASILAKVHRDTEMRKLDKIYPSYGFSNHKGYGGAEEHQKAILKEGLCPIHRKNYNLKFLKGSSLPK